MTQQQGVLRACQLHSLDGAMAQPSHMTCSTGVTFGELRWLFQPLDSEAEIY